MALIPATKYPGKTAGATADYPQGEAQNITTPGDGTGTPWEKDLVNDVFGLLQSLLNEAGITPTGNADTVLVPQYVDSLRQMFQGMWQTRTALAAAITVKINEFHITQGEVTAADRKMGMYRIVPSGTGAVDGINFIDIPGADSGAGLQMQLVRFPSDKVLKRSALVQITAVQSIPNNLSTAILWATPAVRDTDTLWSAGTPTRLTVPAGIAQVRLTAGLTFASNVINWRALEITKNGGGTQAGLPRATTPVTTVGVAVNPSLCVKSEIIDVSPADYFEAEAHQTSGGPLNLLVANTFFGMELVG